MPQRIARRNGRDLWYCPYNASVPVYEVDADGTIIYDTMPDGTRIPRETGATTKGYGEAVKFFANLSAAKGMSETEMFGTLVDYTKVIVTCDTSLAIDENAIVFESEPTGTIKKEDADYEVVRVAKSVNVLAIAVKTIPKNA